MSTLGARRSVPDPFVERSLFYPIFYFPVLTLFVYVCPYDETVIRVETGLLLPSVQRTTMLDILMEKKENVKSTRCRALGLTHLMDLKRKRLLLLPLIRPHPLRWSSGFTPLRVISRATWRDADE